MYFVGPLQVEQSKQWVIIEDLVIGLWDTEHILRERCETFVGNSSFRKYFFLFYKTVSLLKTDGCCTLTIRVIVSNVIQGFIQ